MPNLGVWLVVALNIALAVTANSASTIWATRGMPVAGHFWAVVILSPLIFLSFGYTASKLGLAVASGVIDSLLTVSSVLVGLAFFGEWRAVSASQVWGLALAVTGIVLLHRP